MPKSFYVQYNEPDQNVHLLRKLISAKFGKKSSQRAQTIFKLPGPNAQKHYPKPIVDGQELQNYFLVTVHNNTTANAFSKLLKLEVLDAERFAEEMETDDEEQQNNEFNEEVKIDEGRQGHQSNEEQKLEEEPPHNPEDSLVMWRDQEGDPISFTVSSIIRVDQTLESTIAIEQDIRMIDEILNEEQKPEDDLNTTIRVDYNNYDEYNELMENRDSITTPRRHR